MPDEIRHSLAAIEIGDGSDYRLPFGFRFGEMNGILQFGIWNINCRFHAAIIHKEGFP